MLTWIEALKKWNEKQEKWSIPKKESAGYLEIKEMMKNGKIDMKHRRKTPKPKQFTLVEKKKRKKVKINKKKPVLIS